MKLQQTLTSDPLETGISVGWGNKINEIMLTHLISPLIHSLLCYHVCEHVLHVFTPLNVIKN